jgi:hypothetical protein
MRVSVTTSGCERVCVCEDMALTLTHNVHPPAHTESPKGAASNPQRTFPAGQAEAAWTFGEEGYVRACVRPHVCLTLRARSQPSPCLDTRTLHFESHSHSHSHSHSYRHDQQVTGGSGVMTTTSKRSASKRCMRRPGTATPTNSTTRWSRLNPRLVSMSPLGKALSTQPTSSSCSRHRI